MAKAAIGAAGIWVGCSQTAGARAVEAILADARRDVLHNDHKPDLASWKDTNITAAWLGHSTVLINFLGLTILTDPALMTRVGASTPMGTIGAKRLVTPALSARELPAIDLVLLSHAHMDHLDFGTIERLPGRPKAVTARGTAELLEGTRLDKPVELGWGEKISMRTRNGDVAIKAFEVKHWGARWRWDSFRGYNGYAIEREGRKIIFGGDTALTDTFAEVRSGGPFEAAIMPIGAYDPWLCSHCSPEQAVRMANAAGAEKFLPVHFKTFPFGREGVHEPLERLSNCIHADRIGWQDVGQTIVL